MSFREIEMLFEIIQVNTNRLSKMFVIGNCVYSSISEEEGASSSIKQWSKRFSVPLPKKTGSREGKFQRNRDKLAASA